MTSITPSRHHREWHYTSSPPKFYYLRARALSGALDMIKDGCLNPYAIEEGAASIKLRNNFVHTYYPTFN